MHKSQLDLGVKGIEGELRGNVFTIKSSRALKVLSSSAFNGGFVKAKSIINIQVTEDFDHANPEKFLEEIKSKLSLRGPTVGLLTAVKMENLSIRKHEDKVKVVAITTAGVTHPAAAGDRIRLEDSRNGTINTILLVDSRLSDGAMVEAVKTATEAKVLVMSDLDIRSRYSGEVASGTITDTIVVACTEKGEELMYSGPATAVGRAIARTVKTSIEESVRKQHGLVRNRSLLDRLKERGVTLEDLVHAGMQLSKAYTQARTITSFSLQKELLKALSDVNVTSLVVAAIRLQDDVGRGAIPELKGKGYGEYPRNFTADKIIGIALANYVAGTAEIRDLSNRDKGELEFTSKVSPFMDNAIRGLLIGIIFRIFHREV